ncbi:hypothetical protein [Streptomyces botrytidirepellens]|uniref:Uncharacterized protein n=1 Tax=Streptomyces botrytidirepellens TaxID=2486417 RepID=A0A3M8VUV6_9ACTN|nr:hypothetical protein [Streptomyces botrytidirepellens]RNG21622.1 hypothetical protein EEJ42_22215 [Streptomyces botrytidirepellens]
MLVTDGDPLILPDRIEWLLDALEEHAPQVEIVRIATRVPLQDLRRVDARMKRALRRRSTFRVEVATHINHRGELFPEVREAYAALQEAGARIYDQTVLLRGLNDNLNTLSSSSTSCAPWTSRRTICSTASRSAAWTTTARLSRRGLSCSAGWEPRG